jgi:superfamily I DNA/RNA helicase
VTDAAALCAASRAFVIAPAGYGKTELIAEAVRYNVKRRNLVLTHTNAGVETIRQRMNKLRVPASTYVLDTIARWSFRLAASFPKTTGVDFKEPQSEQWKLIYAGVVNLLTVRAIRRVVESSYDDLFVDEYQDCSSTQHSIIASLAECVPTRVLGDPLQSIFDFAVENVVSWDDDVRPFFQELPGLTIPRRWERTNPALGEWLVQVRRDLESRQPIDLRAAPAGAISFTVLPQEPKYRANLRRRACVSATCRPGERLLALVAWPQQCHQLAAQTRGKYRSPEPVECEELFSTARAFDCASGGLERARITFSFACDNLTNITPVIGGVVERLLRGGRMRSGYPYKNLHALEAFQKIIDESSSRSILEALLACQNVSRAAKIRAELFENMIETLQESQTSKSPSLEEAAIVVRNRARRKGRWLGRFTVSRTLLMKGLQFDHGIVLDADALDSKNLYVALTRASRTLHVVADTAVLSPKE